MNVPFLLYKISRIIDKIKIGAIRRIAGFFCIENVKVQNKFYGNFELLKKA